MAVMNNDIFLSPDAFHQRYAASLIFKKLRNQDHSEKAPCLGKDDDLHTTTSVIVLEHLKLEDEVDIFFKPNIEKTVLKMLMFHCHLLSDRNILRKGVCIDGDPRGPRGFQPLV